MATGFTTVSSTSLKDSTGTLIDSATISFQPVSNKGAVISFRAGGGGQVVAAPVSAIVENGVFTVQLADTTLTSPINVGYRVTVIHNVTGKSLLGPGYECVQPSGAAWSFDTYDPILDANVTVSTGPQGLVGPRGNAGPQGPAGPAGADGTITADSVSGNFTVPNTLSAALTNFAITHINDNSWTSAGQTRFTQGNTNLIQYGTGINDYGSRWTLTINSSTITQSYTRGIAQCQSYQLMSRAMGDRAGVYAYVTGAFGATNQSDEGASGSSWQIREDSAYFVGTVAVAPPTTGDPTTSNINQTLAWSSGTTWMADQSTLLNISRPILSGNFSGAPAVFAIATGLNVIKVPVTGVTLPKATAWGSATGFTAMNTPPTVYAEQTLTVKVGQIDGAYSPFVAGYAMIACNGMPQQTYIISAGDIDSNGNQPIVALVRNNFAGTALLIQGGAAGSYLSMDAIYSTTQMRTTLPCLGSIDGTNLLYVAYIASALWTGPMSPYGAQTSSGANSGFTLYPGAELVELPPQAGAATTSSSAGAEWYAATIEVNNVDWAVGDHIENPRPYIFSGAALTGALIVDSPAAAGSRASGLLVGIGGKNMSGAYSLARLQNSNQLSLYSGAGGYLPSAPTAISIAGPIGPVISVRNLPVNLDPIILVNDAAPTGNWTFINIPGAVWTRRAASGWIAQPTSYFGQVYASRITGSSSQDGQVALGFVEKMSSVETQRLIMASPALVTSDVANTVKITDTGIYRMNSDGTTKKFIPWQDVPS